MPIAGILFWISALVASRFLVPSQLALFVGFGSGTLFPLGLAIDRWRGRKNLADPKSPVTIMFLQSLCSIVMMWPLIILAGSAGLVVVGGAVLMGLVWIPYGWAADDPVGLRHSIARTIGCYGAYVLVPTPWKLTAVCLVPLVCYGYSLMCMKQPRSIS
jgi:hypothetical protein